LGEECYWNVSGDNVSAISIINIEDVRFYDFFFLKIILFKEESMLIVGSEDNSIRWYKGEEIVFEISEASKPTSLLGMNDNKFA